VSATKAATPSASTNLGWFGDRYAMTDEIDVLSHAPECDQAIRDFLAALPHHPTDWDHALSPADQVEILRQGFLETESDAWLVASGGGRTIGLASMRRLAWDTQFFGRTMGIVDLLRTDDPTAAGTLVSAIGRAALALGISHLRHYVDARDTTVSRALQHAGWRVAGGYLRMVAATASMPDREFPVRRGDLEVIDTHPDHLSALTEVASRLPAYNWLEREVGLRPDRRDLYVSTRLRNCVDADFADICVTLLRNGRPVGFNASKLVHHAGMPGGRPHSVERDTFVDSAAVPGSAWVLLEGVSARLKGLVRYVTGRVGLEAVAMQRLVAKFGYESRGAEYCMTWSKP